MSGQGSEMKMGWVLAIDRNYGKIKQQQQQQQATKLHKNLYIESLKGIAHWLVSGFVSFPV